MASPRPTPEQLVQKFGRLNVLDDLIRSRAADVVQEPILAYPKSPHHAGSYEYYTGQDLDGLIDKAVHTLVSGDSFWKPQTRKSTIALLTLSDINMVVTFFALSRLGFTVMMLSPRLSGDACATLLETVGCDTVIYGDTPGIRATLGDILRHKLVSCVPMISKTSLDNMKETEILVVRRNQSAHDRQNQIALILHSSGSTGNPKPLFLSHKAIMTHPLRGPGFTSFNPLPWYHLHGLSTAFQAMWMRRTAFMWNAALPLTADSVVAALEDALPESVVTVPYMLQLLANSPRGLALLRQCKLVAYGGAPCPDELGDLLVEQGIHFGSMLGLTEAGLVAESTSRPREDKFWNYVQFFENIRPYVWMKPISDSLYECVYLAGHPALTASNSDDPPGSFHSKDVFAPHPILPHRWKYVTRLDDRINLVNGEKVLPLPIEGHIKQHPLIHEAVVVGVGKAAPGLLVFRNEKAAHIPDGEYLEAIWPIISEANATAEQFSQISRDMVSLLPITSVCPRTDKGSMIRAQVNLKYADVIDNIYAKVEKVAEGSLALGINETVSVLLDLCRSELGIPISSAESSFFAEGVDSLKAIHLRRLVLRTFKLDGSTEVSQNIVFDMGNIAELAKYICAVQNGETIAVKSDESVMTDLIEKYSVFHQHVPQAEPLPKAKSVILTGATGSIGVHTLFELLNDETISTVFCLTRRASPLEGVLQSLIDRRLSITPAQADKIVALNSPLDQPDLGLPEEIIHQMQDSVTQIIHTAWPVNFNLPLSQYEPHIRGLYNLIQLSLSVRQPDPAVVMFCSSISTALNHSSNTVLEEPLDSFSSALDMGYGQSKLIGERIVSNARRAGARSYSLRIGQVSGHSKKGLWNDSEAMPLMIRSALTLKALPQLDTTCSWLPVDKLAATILELAKACSVPSDEFRCDVSARTNGHSVAPVNGVQNEVNGSTHEVHGAANGIHDVPNGVNGATHETNGIAHEVNGPSNGVNGHSNGINGFSSSINWIANGFKETANGINGSTHETNGANDVDGTSYGLNGTTNGINGVNGHSDEAAPNSTTSPTTDDTIYNVCNSREFTWSALLSSLQSNGFQFETVPFEEWLQKLRESEARGEEHKNPAIKLIDHYESVHGQKNTSQAHESAKHAQKTFVTEKAERDSVTLRNDRLRIIEDGILNCYARDWLTRWVVD
ncbi:hypothetical protein NUU61_007342 [Penicillium alfredii]|uniref:Carrier domain-containing protein n=1 Tax=Penicillium alfredii TaxID=1506179 RepID=A0A9W9F2L7_9EURO|nr:uncharacterized protein NUU61_007342 [Penicillium alfredii]KAJ5092472.1 hypothetical protein NUU61_007342 [Penicillium alfredii]